MKRLINIKIALLLAVAACSSCADYLDVVPEGTGRLENAFSMRAPALRYLYTCYSYITSIDNGAAVDITGSDEVWTLTAPPHPSISLTGIRYAEGLQVALNPLFNYWPHYYQALRDCNIFLENVDHVVELPEWEREQWKAEVKVLKAYYHFMLLRMYGPVPIIRDNLPIDAGTDEVRVVRDPVDDVVNYAVQLINDAIPYLEPSVHNVSSELGRIVLPVALSLKAKILVTAASDLFNGNEEEATLRNRDGEQLFNQTKSPEKWTEAVKACKAAVELCVDSLHMKLYTYPGHPMYTLTSTIMTQMSLRQAITDRWNSELIWGNTRASVNSLQVFTQPKLDPTYQDYAAMKQVFGIPLKVVDQFYTENGVPVEEDKTWGGAASRYELRTATAAEALYIKTGSVTARMNFNREPRFYAWLGFDQGVWYGQGKFDDSSPGSLFTVQGKNGQTHGHGDRDFGPVTGYIPKKYVHFENTQTGQMNYDVTWYIWPAMRLADLFLLYAEALNEADDSEPARLEAMYYLDLVRDRAGLPAVQDAWDTYSNKPDSYRSQYGLRQIIRQERMIELCFEQQRFWDIRRWKTAPDLYNLPIQGWDLMQSEAAYYYRPVTIFRQSFGLKDYFWPIPSGEITKNKLLVQNIGW